MARPPASRKKSTAAPAGTIGQAATKVVKSGARLVQHAGQRMLAAGTKAAKDQLEGALQSSARATSSVLHAAANRVQKIAK
jgi:hypothetical protein